ncbi:MAG: carbohydrate ABC transporter permease [Bacillota bacterium]
MKKLFIILIALVFISPMIWMLATSVQPEKADLKLIPNKFTLENYKELLGLDNFLRWNFNSIFIAVVTTILMCIFSTMAGYSLSKLKIPGANIILIIMIGTMAIPKQAIIVPLFQMMKNFGMINNYLGLILPTLAWPFGVFLMRQSIKTIPSEVIDAARIDGASEFKIFYKIIIPLSKSSITALAIFTFIKSYNDYFWHLIMIRTSEMNTLPLAVASLQQQFDQRIQLIMAGSVFASIPMIIIFLVFSSQFLGKVNLSGIKK